MFIICQENPATVGVLGTCGKGGRGRGESDGGTGDTKRLSRYVCDTSGRLESQSN